jgi:hypothetical protein
LLARLLQGCCWLAIAACFALPAHAEPIPPDRDPAERPPPGRQRAIPVAIVFSAPVIDGRLDDVAWDTANIADRFWISEQERWPTEQTEVLVTSDRRYLYFGFKVFDRKPDEIEALQTRRDSGLGLDDQVAVELDPFLSYREISTYSVSAAGTQDDAIAGGRARQLKWKGDWRAAAVRTEYGWSAEIAIPFDILNFERGSTKFGVNFLRYHNRTSEWSRWADVTVRRLPEERGMLIDLDPTLSDKDEPLTFAPFVLVGKNIPNQNGSIKSTLVTGGIDIRYEPRRNLTGVLSIYPDFSQVETAVTDINFNYNEKFRADNRPFFQEGAAYFGKDTSYFYSNQVPNFNYGGKLFSRTDGYQLGAFVTRSPDERTDYAMRLQREIDATHSIGAMVVGFDQPQLSNTLYVLQGQGRSASGLRYGADGAITRTQGQEGDGSFVQASLGYDRDHWSFGVVGNRYTAQYSPLDSLLPADLPGTRGVSATTSYFRDLGPGLVREIQGNIFWQGREIDDGRTQRNYLYAGGSIETGREVKLSLSWTGGEYRPVTATQGVFSDTVNHDHYWTATLDFNTRSSRFGYGVSYSDGFLNGSDYLYTIGYAWVKPTPTTYLAFSQELLSQSGRSYQTIVNAGWDISPRHGIYARYIWNDGSQTRVAYTLHVTKNIDFFAVYDNQPGQQAQLSAKVLLIFP